MLERVCNRNPCESRIKATSASKDDVRENGKARPRCQCFSGEWHGYADAIHEAEREVLGNAIICGAR